MRGANHNPERCPTHPGALLRDDVIPATGRTKAEIARLLGISRQHLSYGAFRSRRASQNVAWLMLSNSRFLNSTRRTRAFLASKGAPIGPYDVLIAGQAVARQMILVTHNTNEFGRVPGLQIEDWET